MKLTDGQKYNFKLLIMLIIGVLSALAWFYIDRNSDYEFGGLGKHAFGATILLIVTKMLLAGMAISLPILSVFFYFKRDII
mgnify:CR=1 FL=1